MKKEFRGTAKQITSANVIISVFFEEQTGPNLKRSGKSRSTDPSALRQQKNHCSTWELQTLWYLSPYPLQSLVLNNHSLLEGRQ